MFIQCYSLDLRMLFRALFFCFVFPLILGNHAHAQTPSLVHFDVGLGLPSNEVFDLKIDSKGFLWVGTSEGLVRYDGNSFLLLNNPKSRGSAVTGILEDRQGTIWSHNFNGQIFHSSSDSVVRFLAWEPFYKNQLTEFTFDQQGRLVVNNSLNHIYRFNLQKNAVTKLLEASSIKEAIATMHNGAVLFSQVDRGSVSELRPCPARPRRCARKPFPRPERRGRGGQSWQPRFPRRPPKSDRPRPAG